MQRKSEPHIRQVGQFKTDTRAQRVQPVQRVQPETAYGIIVLTRELELDESQSKARLVV